MLYILYIIFYVVLIYIYDIMNIYIYVWTQDICILELEASQRRAIKSSKTRADQHAIRMFQEYDVFEVLSNKGVFRRSGRQHALGSMK